jgi:hypothetical protein
MSFGLKHIAFYAPPLHKTTAHTSIALADIAAAELSTRKYD